MRHYFSLPCAIAALSGGMNAPAVMARLVALAVDERHHRQDTRPAFVPSTVWGTASMQNLHVELGAVLARNSGRLLTLCRAVRRLARPRNRLRHNRTPSWAYSPGTARRRDAHTGGRLWSGLPTLPPASHSARHHPGQARPPSTRGFSPPLTRAIGGFSHGMLAEGITEYALCCAYPS